MFGDAVNTASRIESSSEAQMIHISEVTKSMLDPNEWNVLERGTVELKGKGLMKTYYLLSRRMNTEEDNVTASLAPLKIARKNNSPKAVLRQELRKALKIANREDKPIIKYTNSSVSLEDSYETKLNQMMQMQLSKEVSLTDVYNTKNTNLSDQSYKTSKINSLIDIETQQRQQLHQLQQLQQQTGVDKSSTNKIIINNSFLGNDKIPDAVINASDNVYENNDGDKGCFSCNKKLKSSDRCSIL